MKKFSGFLLLAAVLTGCSDSDNYIDNGSNDREQIILSSKVSFAKSSYDTEIQEGKKVGFYVTEWVDGSTPGNLETESIYNNVELTAGEKGHLINSTSMYYPQSGNKVDFYGYHPRQTTAPTEITAIPFTIVEDQTKLDNYLASDLLWTKKDGVSRTNKAVPLEFKHKLSKVEFVIKKGNGVDLSNLSKVEILNVAPSTTLNLADGSITEAEGTPVNVSVLGITGTNETSLTSGEAIVVPQTIPTGTKLLQITLGDVTFSYTPDKETVFKPELKHTYTITVNMGGIEVTSSIANWGDGGSTEGNGEMD